MSAERVIHNLALIGFMGTGKSSVGRQLAHLLNFRFIDTDELIEEQAGRKISAIFTEEGETRFREYEREVVAEISSLRHCVISTGGGLGANESNLASLKSHAMVFCLWASAESIWERVRNQDHRPLLRKPDPLKEIERLLTEREPTYRQADVLVNTELRSVKEVAAQVLHQFRAAQRRHAEP